MGTHTSRRRRPGHPTATAGGPRLTALQQLELALLENTSVEPSSAGTYAVIVIAGVDPQCAKLPKDMRPSPQEVTDALALTVIGDVPDDRLFKHVALPDDFSFVTTQDARRLWIYRGDSPVAELFYDSRNREAYISLGS